MNSHINFIRVAGPGGNTVPGEVPPANGVYLGTALTEEKAKQLAQSKGYSKFETTTWVEHTEPGEWIGNILGFHVWGIK